MNITILLSAVCTILGAVLYMISGNPKITEISRLTFACGLLAFLLTFSDSALRLSASH